MATKLKKEAASTEKEVKKVVKKEPVKKVVEAKVAKPKVEKKVAKKDTVVTEKSEIASVQSTETRNDEVVVQESPAVEEVESKTQKIETEKTQNVESPVKGAKKVGGEVTAEDLFEAGAHFGHVVKKWNPKMKKYLWGSMNGIHIFDLEKTISGLTEACKTLTHLASTGKRIVMVGTKRQAKQMVEDEAKRIGVPFITQRWMGGLITNWKQVKQTIDRLNKLKKDKEDGSLKKYTKKEQVLFDKEIIKLERVVGGISTLKEAPEVVVVIDTHKERLVVREASSKNVTIVGLVDSNANPDSVNYVIPMNDDSAKGLEIVIAALGKAIENGLKAK